MFSLKQNNLQVLFLHYITLEIILHIRVSCQLELMSISVSNKKVSCINISTNI